MLMLLGFSVYNVYSQRNSWMTSVQPPNQVIKEKISAHVVSAATNHVLEVLDSKPVEREWLGWIDRAF